MPLKVEVEDFSGGITDYYLNAPGNKLKQCENLLLSKYSGMGKPFTRPGSEIYLSTAPQIPAGAQRISTAFYYKNIVFIQSAQKIYYENAGAWTDILGPTGNNAFIGADTSKYFVYSHWNYHTLITHSGRVRPQKLIRNASNVPEIFEAGLPKINSAGITFVHGGGSSNWVYKFVYKQTYVTSGNVTFVDYGSTSLPVEVLSAGLNVDFSNIPAISNGSSTNYRTASIKVEVYRTTSNGTVFYRVGELNNGTTTFTDNVSDATLITNTVLYTTGGVVDNDSPPKCKTLHISKDNIAYYANIEDSLGQVLTNRCVQSVPGDIDSVPESFFIDVDDEIVSVSSTKSNVVLLCKHSIYRLDGAYDELGRGEIAAERISDTAGCVSAMSSVQALDGVFWCGLDGVYYTDGFKVIKVNIDFDKTYRTYTLDSITESARAQKIQGKYDSARNRIWWALQREGTDVDTCYILDLNWGIREDATFTLASGNSFAPTAIEFINGNLLRCDKRGYVFIHKDTLYTDPLINTAVSPSLWTKETIRFYLESIAYNFGSSAVRKYTTGVNVTCESSTNLSLQITSNNDDNRVIGDLKPIRYRGNITWGDEDVYWGDTVLEWNKQGLIHEKRRVPAKSIRCNYKRILLTNAKVAILSSDQIGLVNINAAAKTATLVSSGTYDWPSNAVDYYLAFERDNYVAEYLVTARTSDVLTYDDDTDATVSANNQKWVLRGYPKGEVLNLLNYSLVYEMSGPTLGVYNTTDSGEVGS
jgi:hypothetical protein